MFFPQLLSRYKRIEITIKIKANFYKEIAQFTILVAIIGNKISKYFFLTSLSQIPYMSTQQTYMGSKFNSRDPACYDLFSFSDTSSSQIITKKTVARTIEPSWQNTCLIWQTYFRSGHGIKCRHRLDEKWPLKTTQIWTEERASKQTKPTTTSNWTFNQSRWRIRRILADFVH